MLMFRNKSMILLLLLFRISQGSVVTRLRCRGKYGKSLVENLLPSPTMKEFLKSANISQSYERILSGTFFYGSQCIFAQRYSDCKLWSIYESGRASSGLLPVIVVYLLCPRPVGGRGRGH